MNTELNASQLWAIMAVGEAAGLSILASFAHVIGELIKLPVLVTSAEV